MLVGSVPAGYSAIHTGIALGNRIQFTVRAIVHGNPVVATATDQGVSLMVRECQFHAIAEFNSPQDLSIGLHDPMRWHIGYVQNVMDGGIVYRYAQNGVPATAASICPQIMPCRDAVGPNTWYDTDFLGLKRFGVAEEYDQFIPDDIAHDHAARAGNLTRYVQIGDAPGSGNLPLNLPCRQVDAQGRAVLNPYRYTHLFSLNAI